MPRMDQSISVVKRRGYSVEDDAAIKDAWPDVRAAAALLDRTHVAIRARARHLGLGCASGRSKRPFTEAEREAVRERYPLEGPMPLAKEFGRTVADFVSLAQRMQIRFDGLRRWTVADDAAVIAMRYSGASVGAIAEQLDRTVSAVYERFKKLGLSRPGPDRVAVRQKGLRVRQLTEVCDVRWARERMAMGEHGWPPDMNPKEVAILESLRKTGPQSRYNLSISIGEPVTRAAKKRLMTHGGRSAMSRLMTRGLVARLILNERRKKLTIYTLTELAVQNRGTYGSVIQFNAEAASRGQTLGRSS